MTVLVTMTKMVIVIEDPSYREGAEGGLLGPFRSLGFIQN